MFKIGNSKELPTIPDHLSEEGKDFVRECLQRDPLKRPRADKLLEHPFVKNATPLEKPLAPSDPPSAVTNGVKSLGIEHVRNHPIPESEKLAIHSSRVSKSNFHSSNILIPRNVSCPVSPVGSPLLHPRSPPHLNGRMSPSPISSPRATSGSSTPLTGGTGAIPFHHLNQFLYAQEGYGSVPKSPQSPYMNGPSYWDPDFPRGMQSGSHAFRELATSENGAPVKQFGRPGLGELHDGQSVLADRVSQQLLRDPVKLNPSLDLNCHSPLTGRTNGA